VKLSRKLGWIAIIGLLLFNGALIFAITDLGPFYPNNTTEVLSVKKTNTPTPVPSPSPEQIKKEIFNLVNKERLRNGANPLNLNAKLSISAEIKAKDIIARDYWAHIPPNGSTWDPFVEAGYPYLFIGENLAEGQTTSNETLQNWMASPGHRKYSSAR